MIQERITEEERSLGNNLELCAKEYIQVKAVTAAKGG